MKIKRALAPFVSRLTLPEFRFFWLFLLLAGILVAIDVVGFPSPGAVGVRAATLAVLGGAVFWSSYRLAASNQEAKAASGRLESIIANLSDGVIAYDSNFRVLVFNAAAERIFSLTQAQVIGQYIGPERAGEAQFRVLTQVMFPSLAPAVVRHSEAGVYPQIVDISFGQQELRVSTDRIVDENGQVLGFVKLVRDRTREVELLRSKSEFITVAAHQLRTPLTAINWIFEGLMKNESLNKEDKELVVNGSAAAKKLLKIVNDLLDVSKIEEGRFGYSFNTMNLIDFISEVLTNAQAVAKEYGVALYFDRGGESNIQVTIDPDRLALALSNLIDNAIRYNVEHGSVTVGIKRLTDRPYVEVSVKDTGIGIPPENIDKIFSKFFRADNVMKRETEGSGLGLYITKNIINRHGGEIWVESVVNRGTTVYFTLPTDPKLVPPREVAVAV